MDAARWPWDRPPVCLITGAARGLGYAVAGRLAALGATVLLSARDAAAAEAAAAALRPGGDVRPLGIDVSSRASVDAAAQVVDDLDVLINNAAAYVDWGEVASSADLAASRAVMETNLYGAWNMAQAFLPVLKAGPHPRVVNVASGAGSHGDTTFGLAARGGAAASYGISKAALLALTATLAAELSGTRVMVNAVDPDLTATWPGAEAMGARPVGESVAGVVWAATLPDDGPRGGFFRDGRPHPW
ncbi:MAG TPA: SDR family NAD(P)-dependent oxidoreductase [Acidimicrobiales bacterium]|nr:SDR family NAD(P)-dependent oxidoreductase [Acidimicrobiales bacterium]